MAQARHVSTGRQLRQLLTLIVWSGTSPADYYRYRMYRGTIRQANQFLARRTYRRQRDLYCRLSIDTAALSDKRRFYQRCAVVGLAVPETVAAFEAGAFRPWLAGSLPRCDLFAKEAASLCGAGTARWDFDGDERWRGPGGVLVDEAGLIGVLNEESRSAPMLLQRRVENHPELAGLGPTGLCSVRIVTIRAPGDEAPEPLVGVFKMPTGGQVADNFSRGGLACPVDLPTGTLAPAVYKRVDVAHIDVTVHPDTGAAISGRRLPHWADVISLAIRAHRCFPDFPSVGWDIAITADCPILIEGNYIWGLVNAQQPGCRPLGTTRFIEHERAWRRRARERVIGG